MSRYQHPLGTPFPPEATADDVLAGLDLAGINAIVTGGHAGIGLEVTRALSRVGARVTVGARDLERAAAALAGLERVDAGRLDLVDPASIDAFAARWLDGGRPLHLLVNGAGASGGPERDARGYETQFATNHLGHFQLTLALLPALRRAHGARVVNVSSGAQRFGRIRWDDPNFTTGYDNRGLHRDHVLALRTAAATVASMLMACTFWIGSLVVLGQETPGGPRRDALVALTSLRRNLFPEAARFEVAAA